ncbi:hypothetical protein CspeluHIS016_0902240 [Cutaneotrichosporon spelunceum]|uniref:Uncharacterized protein n=1 Tax=Cutaneotrichosporon spelunceum TaxID=1672016 RepID=A0AAD3YFH8_9TREE|nr:hypothetical protein CspeluHIS016_0902240 [Cutaneotrichosporon spelunceum]
MSAALDIGQPPETRLGPFFFTYRPHAGEDAITVPGYFVPFNWPPPGQPGRAAPSSSFVYTQFAPSPVQPVWSMSADTLVQCNNPAPPSSPSPSSSYETAATTPMSSNWPNPYGSSSRPPSHDAWLPVQHPASSSVAKPIPTPRMDMSPPSALVQGGAEECPVSSSYGAAIWSPGGYKPAPGTAPYPIVPEISITEASTSSPSLLAESIGRHTALFNGYATPHGHLTPDCTPPDPARLTQPCSTKLTTPCPSSQMATSKIVDDVDLSDLELSDLEHELETRHHQRKPLPTEWLIPERSYSPIDLMDVDEVPESPTLEHPARPSSVTSSVDGSLGLRRRRGQILRGERPTSCLPYISSPDLAPSPRVLKAKSMSALGVTSGEELEIRRLLTVKTRRAPSPPLLTLNPLVLEDVVNMPWSKGMVQVKGNGPQHLSPSSSSSLFTEERPECYVGPGSLSSFLSQEPQPTAVAKTASSTKEAISSLAELLKDSLVIAEPSEGCPSPSSKSELDLDFEKDIMWSDRVVIGDSVLDCTNSRDCRLECEALLEKGSGSPIPRNAVRACRKARDLIEPQRDHGDSDESKRDGDWPYLASAHELDIEDAFGRKKSFAPAPRGYVHIDDVSLSSGTHSTSSLGDHSSSSGSLADMEEQAHCDDTDDCQSEVSFESGGPTISPCTSCGGPDKLLLSLYLGRGPLATIVELSDEDSPKARSHQR